MEDLENTDWGEHEREGHVEAEDVDAERRGDRLDESIRDESPFLECFPVVLVGLPAAGVSFQIS